MGRVSEELAARVEHSGTLHGWRRSVNDRRLPRRGSVRGDSESQEL